MSAFIREATAADMARVCEIYNRTGIATTASYDLEPTDEAHWLNWFAGQQAAGRPCLVAEADGRVAGYATWSPFRAKPGWARTVEHSVYVAPEAQGRGLGRALLGALVERATNEGVHVMVGVLDAANDASGRLHAALGFELAGVIREGGRKFDRWLDAAFWTRTLA